MSKWHVFSTRWAVRLAFVALLLATVWQYRAALHFGFWWDDPVWYSHMPGRSWWQLLLPIPEFQYYRPGSMLYVSFFLRGDGTFDVFALHWLQIGWHLLQVALSFAIVRLLRLGRWPAVVVALLVALFPFSYQATAWAAPNQPMAAAFQGAAWLFFLLGVRRQHRGWYVASLLLFFVAMMLQESSVALAFVPFLLLLVVKLRGLSGSEAWQNGRSWLRHPLKNGWLWPMLYPLVALLFVAGWSLAPRQAGITGLIFEGKTAVYLLQSVAYPLLARLNGYAPDHQVTAVVVLAIVVVTTVVLLWLAARQKRLALALAGLGWALLSMLPAIVGLRFSYVSLASRLLHIAAPGIVLLWVSALWGRNGRSWLVWLGRLLLVAIALQSGLLLRQFERLYMVGTDHLQATIDTLAGSNNGRLLFINYPDRYAPKRPPFPLGYWGMTLAPVVVELDDFLPLVTTTTAGSASYSMPWVDQMRQAEVYDVDLRGVIIQPNELARLALEYDGVYLTRYGVDGRFQLQEVGRLAALNSQDCVAVFDDTICLQEVALRTLPDQLEVRLTWSTAAPLPPEYTVFVHLGQAGVPPVAQADGDTWLGLLPLADWPVATAVIDLRTLPRPASSEPLQIRLGVYNRVSGERLAGVDAGERPLPDNAFVVVP
ncbi:MAG: hypothetical protein R3D55_17425 [Chloroflexota bacterium]